MGETQSYVLFAATSGYKENDSKHWVQARVGLGWRHTIQQLLTMQSTFKEAAGSFLASDKPTSTSEVSVRFFKSCPASFFFF